ncbi:triple tyrosine motif-containing protein [uncultured Polaribacter sp.]|uniref:helix-turn-helix and ligand-binding sensor domain-containing protein n=1 Tax=uncultured Polaribacter sp. TaxID=174711 RepID=UPI00261487B8|nr:triple tyrosine motif-containing protein [uncultured Polaribacter sp.]
MGQDLPPINVFTPENYKAESQNWDISQSENSFIYAANNKGLLEYNGASWQLYETPNETIMRSVKAFEGKIFTGFYMDFGFWIKNEFGNLNFSSIVKKQKITMLEDEQIWNIIKIDGWMLFKSLQRIYLYNLETKEIKIIEAKNKNRKLSIVDGVIYFQKDEEGLFKIENGTPKLVSNNTLFMKYTIVDIFKKENKLLILTEQNGFYLLDNKRLVKWKIPSENLLKNKKVYSVKQLRNGNFAIGTISHGLIYLNSDGSYNYQINQNTGLSNSTVLSIFEDRSNNIWLGLDNGINCINNTSPFKIYQNKNDFLGTIYTSIIHDGYLYLGTNQGLFYKKNDSETTFKFIENTQGQVWSLEPINNTLFCGHDSGTFIVNKAGVTNIFEEQGTWMFLKINENTILQGCYDGLYILEKENNLWTLKNKIEGFDTSSKNIVHVEKNTFFVNHEYKGVFKVKIDDNFREIINLEKEASINKGLYSSIIKYKNEILYANKAGVYKYIRKKNTFKKDSLYSQLISENGFVSAKLVYNESKNKLWSFSKDHIKYLFPGKFSSTPQIQKISISESIPKAASGYENIIHLKEEQYLLGTSKGFMKVNLNLLEDPLDFKVAINKVNSFVTDEPKESVDLSVESEFAYKNNNLEFFYSVPNFDKINTTTYQYQLVGVNKGWSEPTKSNSILFENISYGDYVFQVRAIIGGKLSVNEALFNFRIARPWYLSTLMITLYILLSLLSFYLVHIASKRYYRKQREVLLEKAKKESELKELESNQQIIKLNNEKLRNDINSKNKELATSTMSMIKKNEFLSTIKNELLSGEEKNVAKVVKIIDKNLNNTDDWKMFQEAFNNADKKFLDKIKAKHSDLTPNDLRLCAYLRLNLSSKEIAPLLNISPRSVEVKRYRLRKKMHLDHNANLTNYILEV